MKVRETEDTGERRARLRSFSQSGRAATQFDLESARGIATMARARSGDLGAVEAVLEAIRPLVVAAAARQLSAGDVPAADAAEDVAQLTLLRVAKHLSDCRAESPRQFAAWALAIARRAALDARRRAPLGESAVMRMSLDELLARGTEPREAAEVLGTGAGLEGSPAVVAILRAALSAYATTNAATAELVWTRVIVGATWGEIGHALGLAPGVAKRRFQRVQVMLRRETLRRVHALPDGERAPALALVQGWDA